MISLPDAHFVKTRVNTGTKHISHDNHDLDLSTPMPESRFRTLEPRPLYPDMMGHIRTIEYICSVLRSWGEGALAGRVAYFASDEDLEAEDIPVTLESARGFLAFFSAVKSDGRVSLTCSPEGWLCATWRFPDERRASVWFLNERRVMFAATDTAGNFVELDNRNEEGDYREVMAKLVQAGLFEWHLDTSTSGSFPMQTTLPGIVLSDILTKMGFPWKALFDSEKQNLIYPLIGQSTSIPQTGNLRLTESSRL